MSIITLTTDFGTKDWFVGTLKGVILKLNPKARIVDLTHEISPGDIRAGAFALRAACRFFPRGTIHVAVVDPGVGSRRRALAIQTDDYSFVGPDNGVLSFAVAGQKLREIRSLETADYLLEPVSRTFHGRDVFAPVAAHLSRGVSIRKLGPRLQTFIRLRWPEPRAHATSIEGEVVYIDRFGNAITNLDMAALAALGADALEVRLGGKRVCPVAEFYGSVPTGRSAAVLGSGGLLEIAVNGGSAAQRLKLRIGDRVIAQPRSPK